MKVGIIAAGEGSRLKEDGVSTLKPLVKVDGVPLLERLLRQYHSLGVTQAFCIVNERSTSVKEYIEHARLPLAVHFQVKSTESSMHSLFELSRNLKGESFLLSTVDSIFETSELVKFFDRARSLRGDGLLAVTSHGGDENPLWVELDQSDRIVAFRRAQAVEPLVTGGLYFFSPRIFDLQDHALSRNISRLRNFLSLLVESGYILRGYRFRRIIDVDHERDIHLAEQFLRSIGGQKAVA